ncbi:MAG: SDR family oxidoreductase, partial [Proteobacteria bacterium]|nr:SDR family oxidoreductase [Pseudomonadota bacterium]
PSTCIINVASEASPGGTINFDDLGMESNYTAFGAYVQSKHANIMFTYELARRLAGSRVTTNAVHPGTVRSSFGEGFTGLVGFGFRMSRPLMRSPKRGAQGAIWLASSAEAEGITGKYFKDKKEIRSTSKSYDREKQTRLWEVSEAMTGVRW